MNAEVRIVEVPVGKDVTEWVQKGGTVEKLQELRNKAPKLTPEALVIWREHHGLTVRAAEPKANAVKLEAVSANDLLTAQIDEPVAVISRLLWPGLTIFAGRPKVGKSWFALQLAVAAATSKPFLDNFRPRS
jgi:hypothetical protein